MRAVIFKSAAALALVASACRGPAPADSDRDGFPDVMELSAESDRDALRRWSCAIALHEWRRGKEGRSSARDCADFLVLCLREALKSHDGAWRRNAGWPAGAGPGPDVAAYRYPRVPWAGTKIFRAPDGSFGAYATSEALREANARFVSRNVSDARDGDLLFFRHPESGLPDHGMLVCEGTAVYHSGPSRDDPGRVKRVALGELAAHPDVSWRPIAENERFLGVYRWRILD